MTTTSRASRYPAPWIMHFALLILLLSHIAPFTCVRAWTLGFPIHSQSHRTRLFLYQQDDTDDDDDDDEPPDVDVSQFRMRQNPESMISFGYNKGRSSPNQRKAMGRSASGVAHIHLCSNCGSEFVKWMGRCPTCKEWNTLQEHAVVRQQQDLFSSSSSTGRPLFGSKSNTVRPQHSWLDGVLTASGESLLGHGGPVRITDLYPSDKDTKDTEKRRPRERILVPYDDELNTVLGGGIMPGSLVLVGGDPGVGKSTLLLQTAGSIASLATPTPTIGMGLPPNYREMEKIGPVWYCSGEESPDQIASRAQRLGIDSSELWLLAETNADSLCAQVVEHLQPASTFPRPAEPKIGQEFEEGEDEDATLSSTSESNPQPLPPSLVVIDSIQTMTCDAGGQSSAGGVTQVRECVAMFLRLAKSTGIPILLVGHVTKSGDVAGPRTVEHMVDAVLYLEGSVDPAAGMNRLRVLRASKNRFGSSEEVGVYEMMAGRLLPISDPSSLFLSHRISEEDAEGCAITIALEGMRAMTVEVQALVTISTGASGFGRRTVDGISNSRLMLLMGVLQKRCGISVLRNDVYLNIAGKMRLDRGQGNGADLATAVALVSSHLQIGVRADTAFCGEIGLLGELRPVEFMEKRMQEAKRMGFSRVISPLDTSSSGASKSRRKGSKSAGGVFTKQWNGIEWVQCSKAYDAIQAGLIQPISKSNRKRQSKKTPSTTNPSIPGNLQDLDLFEIMDDEEDDIESNQFL